MGCFGEAALAHTGQPTGQSQKGSHLHCPLPVHVEGGGSDRLAGHQREKEALEVRWEHVPGVGQPRGGDEHVP